MTPKDEGVGCSCGWPLDPCNRQFLTDGKCDREAQEGAKVIELSRATRPEACPARVAGPFLGTEAQELRCGGEKGHTGDHFFHVWWSA